MADGVVAEAPAFTTAENQATEQAAQIQNMILEGYDAIVVNAASPTALNGAVKEACDAGIVVVTLRRHRHRALRLAHRRGLPARWAAGRSSTSPGGCPRAATSWRSGASPGVFVDDEISAGIHAGVEEFPQFAIVGSVHGDWAQDVAQRAVAGILPSLPDDIVGVVTQGGDGYGAAQAFAAAGREMPIIIMGNRQDELTWWKEQADASGYETMSVSIAPGVSTLAFWVAQQVLDGAEVPKDLVVPFLSIDQAGLDASLETTPEGGVANVEYTLEDAQAVIAGARADDDRGSGRHRPGRSRRRPRAAPVVALEEASRAFGAVRALDGRDAGGAARRGPGPRGPQRRRQVHAGQPPDRRARAHRGAGGLRRGRRRARPASARWRRSCRSPRTSPWPRTSPSPSATCGAWPGGGRPARRIRAALDAVFPGHGIDPDATRGRPDADRAADGRGGDGLRRGRRRAPRLVILDEPTSSLDASPRAPAPRPRRAASGRAAAPSIFISHVLGEVLACATRIVVLRDGRAVADRPAAAFDRARPRGGDGPRRRGRARARRRGRRARPRSWPTPEGLRARAGEVVGLTGLAGHGQAEALARLYLARTSDWRGRGAGARPPSWPGDRARDGVMPLWSIARNASLGGAGAR